MPWLVWLSGLNTSLRIKGSPVRFSVRAHAWVVGQVPSKGHVGGNHALMFLSLTFSLNTVHLSGFSLYHCVCFWWEKGWGVKICDKKI